MAFPTAPTSAASFYASEVVSATRGDPAQSGFGDVGQALGAPSGSGGSAGAGGEGSTAVYNLGVGGSLTLGFDGPSSIGGAGAGATPTPRGIADGDGADFIVFENAFRADDDPATTFAELVFVEVSSNGTDFARFRVLSATEEGVGAFGTIDAAAVSGFAGVTPVYANPAENDVNPFDPAAAGGDAFDLADLSGDPLVAAGKLDLDAVRFVRLVDVIGDGRHLDAEGRPIYDPTGLSNGGADIDALSVIHGVTVPEPATSASVILGGVTLLLKRPRGRRAAVTQNGSRPGGHRTHSRITGTATPAGFAATAGYPPRPASPNDFSRINACASS